MWTRSIGLLPVALLLQITSSTLTCNDTVPGAPCDPDKCMKCTFEDKCWHTCNDCESCVNGECVFDKPDKCLLGSGKCYSAGQFLRTRSDDRPNGYDNCNSFCDPTKANTSLVHAPLDAPCDDGYFCTSGSVCKDDGLNSVCTAPSGGEPEGPCAGNPFCTSICSNATRECKDPCREPSCREVATCEGSTCSYQPMTPPPSCVDCPCESDGVFCNVTSGECLAYKTSPSPSPAAHAHGGYFTHSQNVLLWSILGGVVGAVTVIVFVTLVRRHRLRSFQHRTVYHHAPDPDDTDREPVRTRVISKGL